jgi:hypothetical protein
MVDPRLHHIAMLASLLVCGMARPDFEVTILNWRGAPTWPRRIPSAERVSRRARDRGDQDFTWA